MEMVSGIREYKKFIARIRRRATMVGFVALVNLTISGILVIELESRLIRHYSDIVPPLLGFWQVWGCLGLAIAVAFIIITFPRWQSLLALCLLILGLPLFLLMFFSASIIC